MKFPKFQKHGNFQKAWKHRNFWKAQKHRNSSGNLGSVGMFRKLWKHGNSLRKPWNASVSLETPEGHLIGILTWLSLGNSEWCWSLPVSSTVLLSHSSKKLTENVWDSSLVMPILAVSALSHLLLAFYHHQLANTICCGCVSVIYTKLH